jgi:hypothetical protein
MCFDKSKKLRKNKYHTLIVSRGWQSRTENPPPIPEKDKINEQSLLRQSAQSINQSIDQSGNQFSNSTINESIKGLSV